MSRYLNSFFISLVLYVSIFSFLIYQAKDDNFCDKKNKDVTRVSISVINNQPIVKKDELKPEKKVEKKIHKKETKKVRKVVKKELLPIQKKIQDKPKEIVKKEIKKEVKEETKKEEIAKVEEKQVKKQEAQKAINTKITKTKNNDVLKAKQDMFLANLVKRINSNKSYPNSARRRGIQGNIEMRFFVLKSGHVKDINLISGRHIFKRSAIEAIEKSFPINVDETLFNFPKEFKITIAYILK